MKIFRINYKSDFIMTLESDAGWMTPFCIKFWTGAPSQAYFVGFDGTTYTHCSYDPSEPTKLTVQFDDHHLPVGELKYQVAYHFTVADFPNDTEDEVINPGNIAVEIDGARWQVMLDFTGETAPELAFSLPAYANEQQRIQNEQERIAHEEQRIANEQQRIQNEETRQAHEAQRIAQETARVNEFATLKSQSQAATSAANTAAALANDKAQLANEKAALAQQKAEYAQQQGGYAKDQGDYAKNQGDYAKEQGDTALADHQRAEADHGTAVDDHTQAGSDHTRAESDHARAESDHAAVEVYVDSLGVFDLSKHNAVGGVLATYADLSAALTALNALDSKYKYGGMSIKFVQSSDNHNYVQARCMAQNFTTDVTQWQGVDDLPTVGSDNLVKSRGVAKVTHQMMGEYSYSGLAKSKPSYVIPEGIDVVNGKKIHVHIDFDSATSSDWSVNLRRQDDTSISGTSFTIPSGSSSFDYDMIPAATYDDARLRVYTTENDKSFSVVLSEVSSIKTVEKNTLDIHNLLGEKEKEVLINTYGTFSYNSTWQKYVLDIPITYTYDKDLPATFYVKKGESINGIKINCLNSNYNILTSYDVNSDYFENIVIKKNTTIIRLSSDTDLGVISVECIIGTFCSFISYYISTFGKTFGGEITPISSVDPKNHDIFYLANTAGNYSNLANGLLLTQGDIALVAFDNSINQWAFNYIVKGEVKYQEIYQIKGTDLAIGRWNEQTGKVVYHSNRVISPWIYVERGAEILNSIQCQIVLFDPSKIYQSNSWKNANSITYIKESGYIRLVFVTEDSQTDYSNFDNSVTIKYANAYSSISRDRIETSKSGDFVRGYYDTDGSIHSHTNRACSTAFYKVKKGDFVLIDSKNYLFRVVYWDESKNFLNIKSKYCRLEFNYPQYNSLTVGQIVVPYDGYINIELASIVSDAMTDTEILELNNLIMIGHVDREYYNDKAWNVNNAKIVYKKPKFIHTQATISQGGTFVNGNLWLFGETNENINIINPVSGEILEQKTQNLGHMSNVDYNEETDTLLSCMNGYLFLYKSPSEKSSLLKTDSECMQIDVSSIISGTYILPGFTVMWGEDKDVIYGVLGSKQSTTELDQVYSNEHTILKVQLGLGDNDLSNDGFGAFISGKGETEYNGTGKVLMTYNGMIYEGIDTITSLDSRPYLQDAEYDGDIFLGFGIREHNFLRIRLDDDTQSFRVIENYQHKFFNYDRSTQLFYEPEMTAIHNGRLYCGSRNQYITPDSVLLSFEL